MLGASSSGTSQESQYSGKIRFIEKPGIQDEGDLYVAKRSSDCQVACPEVKVQGSDLVRVVGIGGPLPHWGPVPGETSFLQNT